MHLLNSSKSMGLILAKKFLSQFSIRVCVKFTLGGIDNFSSRGRES